MSKSNIWARNGSFLNIKEEIFGMQPSGGEKGRATGISPTTPKVNINFKFI